LDWRSYGQDESSIVSLLHVMSFGTAKPIFLGWLCRIEGRPRGVKGETISDNLFGDLP
jgi:hypothetical protein